MQMNELSPVEFWPSIWWGRRKRCHVSRMDHVTPDSAVATSPSSSHAVPAHFMDKETGWGKVTEQGHWAGKVKPRL